MQHIASISYGKDSLAMLEVIKQHGLPLDRIVHVEIMATKDIPADLPPMMEFKKKADEIILDKYGIPVEHLTAPHTYEEYFYYADIIEDETPSDCFEECAKTLIDEKIEQLPEKDREIMQAVIAGYKQKEIAAMMGIRQPTISRRIKKIQYRLRKEISSLSDRL